MNGEPVTIAVDWSGALRGARRKIWLAEVGEHGLERLECGRDRAELIEHLIARAREEPSLVVGLDFAFSFPRWFCELHAVVSARDMWRLVARQGEEWLATTPHPFWGKRKHPRPDLDPTQSPYRRTESDEVPKRGVGPKSVFQIAGAGSVGTGSLRGMPHLLTLQDAGFAIWPFDAPRLPLVVEIYPRHLTGAVTKSKAAARRLYLEQYFAREPRSLVDRAAANEDAFDAAVSALTMARHVREVLRLPREADATARIEGRIWRPTLDPLAALQRPD